MIVKKHKRYITSAKGIQQDVMKKAEIIMDIMKASPNMNDMFEKDLKHKHPEPVINKPHLYSIRIKNEYRMFFTVSSDDYENENDKRSKIKEIFVFRTNKHLYKKVNLPKIFNELDYE